MRNFYLMLGIGVFFLATGIFPAFAEDATLLRLYKTAQSEIEAGFVPDKSKIILGEPLFLTFQIINRGDKPYSFTYGGDYRGSVRANSFHITAVDEQGEAVKDPYSYNNFGGLMGNKTLKPQEKYTERLFLGHWCAFAKPGIYTVTCKRFTVSASFKLKINPAQPDALRKIITQLDEKLRTGNVQTLSEAALALSTLHEEAIIAPLAAVLTKSGDISNAKYSAIEGISQFPTDSAADALRAALQDREPFIRGAAAEALQKIRKVAHVLPNLLQDIASPIATTREMAARSLGATQSPQALAPLLKALDDADANVRFMAAKSLGELHQPAAVAALKARFTNQKSTEMRLALAQGLINAGEPLQPEWLTPVIRVRRNTMNEWQFHEAISLICQSCGKNAARALASCLKLDDPSAKSSSFNMFLLLALEHAVDNGPKYYYKFHSSPETPAQVEENRQILSKLSLWLKNHK